MHTSFTPIPGTTYRLLETIPYPRANRAGTLTDASGARLHGVYERKIAGSGYRTAVINNGTIFHRCIHQRPSPPPIPGARHSYADFVLHGGNRWEVRGNSTRPTTSYPGTENPYQSNCFLWESYFVQQRLLANVKPAGGVHGTPEQVAAWCAQAEAAGLVTRTFTTWIDTLGGANVRAEIAHRGTVLIGDEGRTLEGAYRGLLPDLVLDGALDLLAALTGEDLLCMDLANPVDNTDLIITGHAYGYPPETTIACINDPHGPCW